MHKNIHLSLVLGSVLLAAGCEKNTVTIATPSPTPVILEIAPRTATNTLETKRLGLAIDQFVSAPSAVNSADVKKAFAEMDVEIAELESRVAQTTGQDRAEAQAKLTNMQTYRAAETARYAAASLAVPMVSPVHVDTRTGAEKVEDSLRNAGDSIEKGADNVGDKIKDATGY